MMKSINPKIILLIYVVAITLHSLFYFSNFSAQLLIKIDNIAILSTIIVCSMGIAYLYAKGLNRSAWAYVGLLLLFNVTRLQLLLEYILALNPAVSFVNKNALMIIHGAVFAFVFVFYPIEILRPRYFTRSRFLLFLLPIVILVALTYLGTLFSPSVNEQIIQFQIFFGYITITAYPFLTLIYALKLEKKHYRWCMDNFSNIEMFQTSWIKYYLLAYLCLHLSYTYIFFFYSNSALNVQTILFFVFITLTLPFVARQENHIPRELIDRDVMSESSSLTFIGQSPLYKQRLLEYMENEKPYLNPDFKLVNLSAVLPLNRSYISKLLNDEIGETFYDFVGRYRVEYSKGLLANNLDLNIADISKLSGFSSPSVYTRTFIKQTNTTPKKFRDSLKS